MDGWLDGWMDGRMDGWMDVRTFLARILKIKKKNLKF